MAKKRTIVAATLMWLSGMASVHAQPGYAPMPPMPPGGVPPGMMPPPLPPAPPGGLPGSPANMPPSNAFYQGRPGDDDCVDSGPRGLQFHVDPFIMWYSGAHFPALLTTGDIVAANVPGALGQPGTQVLFGNKDFVGTGVLGLRLTLAYTFGDEGRGSIDIGGFGVQHRARTYDQSSDAAGSPLITRPFLNAVTGREDADVRAFPGIFAASTHDSFATQYFGGEANVRWEVYQPVNGESFGITLLAGPRVFQLNESYKNFDTATELPAGTGNTFQFADEFGTRNHFAGGQIGSSIKYRWDNMTVDFIGKFIGGNNSQTVNINGYTRLTDASGASATDNGQGLYAMPSNVGQYNREVLSWGGEVGVKLGLRLAENFRFNFGYTFFAVNNIVRPGDQIDRSVNIQPLFSGGGLGVARPLPTLHETIFNTHTINLGFEWLF